MLNSRAIIFDVDGVLVDSYRAHLVSWQRASRDFGLPEMTEPQFAATFGRISREVIAETWPRHNVSPEQARILDETKEAQYRELLESDFPAMPGAAALIDSLLTAGFRLGVGSSGPPPNVHVALAGLGRTHVFGAIVTGADVTRGKPDPQVFLLAANRLGIAPEACCVVEDAPPGIAAAKAAGMKCVGLASHGRTRAELAAANLVVNSLAELSPARLERLIQTGTV